MVVATVCRSGGVYDHRWVRQLENRFYRRLAYPHQFICLTDLPAGLFTPFIKVQPLMHGWPGWWSKIELFRPGLFRAGQPVLYLDLDTVVRRDMDWAVGAIDCDLLLLRDFYRPATGWGSGLMGWTAGQHQAIYTQFLAQPGKWMQRFRSGGDQKYLQAILDPKQVRFWQDEFPGKVCSYKVHCLGHPLPPGPAAVVCFHGKPRPNEVRDKWMEAEWKL